MFKSLTWKSRKGNYNIHPCVEVEEYWSDGATRLRICPSDSDPSGGFPVCECGMRIVEFELSF